LLTRYGSEINLGNRRGVKHWATPY
jgi:hypothetical protein